MTLNNFKCNHLMPVRFKELKCTLQTCMLQAIKTETMIRNDRKVKTTTNIRKNKPSEIHENIELNEKNYLKRQRLAIRVEVTYWQLKVMVSGAKPTWVAFDRWQ